MVVDPSNFKIPAYKHQLEGVDFIVNRLFGGVFDEPGAGKSKQVVDAACGLYAANQEITDVVVACPAGVKRVWSNLRIGEVAKHVWVPSIMNEWDSDSTSIKRKPGKLTWTVVSYECLRNPSNVLRLKRQLSGYKTMLVCDESIKIKGHKSQQTIGVMDLRGACARSYILNGTPTGGNPLDLYCQMEVLSPNILKCDSFYQFRNRHAVMGKSQTKAGQKYPIIMGWTRLDVLKKQVKPHVIRRLKKHCLDLPAKIYHVREIPFEQKSWDNYRQMRDNLIVLLSNGDAAVARQAIVKNIRLRQLTSGFVGGTDSGVPVITSSEKMDYVLNWVDDIIEQEPNGAVIIWAYFNFESERYYQALHQKYATFRIRGGVDADERSAAEEIFNADSKVELDKPIVLIAQQQSGGLGLTLTRSHHAGYASQDYNLISRIQSEDRVDRPGQVTNPNLYDFLVSGPQGQRTMDHTVYKALKTKENIAEWTAADWVREVQNEQPEDFLF